MFYVFCIEICIRNVLVVSVIGLFENVYSGSIGSVISVVMKIVWCWLSCLEIVLNDRLLMIVLMFSMIVI